MPEIVDPTEIETLWLAACKDAEYEPGTEVALYLLPGGSVDGAAALHVEPGSEVVSTEAWPMAPNQVADANSAERRVAHRIFARDFSSRRVALGRLRHELEHARQYDRSSPVYLAMSFTRDALSRAFNEQNPPTLVGSATLYNLLPFEEDANRAAAILTASRFSPANDEELACTDAPLFRDASPIQPDTLAMRLLAFSALFPADFSWVADQRGESVRDLLERLGPGVDEGWNALQLAEIFEHGQAALALCPSEPDVQAAANPADAWDPVKGTIHAGKEAGEAILGDMVLDLS